MSAKSYHEYCVKVLTYSVTYNGPMTKAQLKRAALDVIAAEGRKCEVEIVELPVSSEVKTS